MAKLSDSHRPYTNHYQVKRYDIRPVSISYWDSQNSLYLYDNIFDDFFKASHNKTYVNEPAKVNRVDRKSINTIKTFYYPSTNDHETKQSEPNIIDTRNLVYYSQQLENTTNEITECIRGENLTSKDNMSIVLQFISKAQENFKKLTEAINTLNKENADLNFKLFFLKVFSISDHENFGLKSDIIKLRNITEKLETLLSEHNQDISNVKSLDKILQKKSYKQSNQINSLFEISQALEEENLNLKSKIKDIKSHFESLEKDFNKKIACLTTVNAHLNSSVTQIEQERAELELQLQKLQENRMKLENQIIELQHSRGLNSKHSCLPCGDYSVSNYQVYQLEAGPIKDFDSFTPDIVEPKPAAETLSQFAVFGSEVYTAFFPENNSKAFFKKV